MSESTLTLIEWHKKQAIDAFNQTWNLIDKEQRSREDDNHMIHLAHSSCFHWSIIGTPLNLARGEWQIARVYSILGMSESALYHAQRSLDICQRHSIGDFDLAFAYEAMARASLIAGKYADRDTYLELTNKASEAIADEHDRDYVRAELATIKE